MAYFLIFAIVALLAFIAFQMAQIKRARLEHERKMEIMHGLIAELAASLASQKQQLELSEELMEKLRLANSVLGKDIEGIVREFVQTLSAHNLFK